MTIKGPLAVLFVLLIDSGSCYGISPGTVVGILFADVALTVLVVCTTYWYASKRRQKRENADEVYMNVRANCKS